MSVDLEQYDAEATTKTNLDVSDLDDGDHQFEIRKQPFVKVIEPKDKNAYNIFRCYLTVKASPRGKNDGKTVDWPTFVKDKDGHARLLAMLKKFGFDADAWTVANSRPASKELGKAVLLMEGMVFSATVKTNGNYKNINVKERLPDGLPNPVTKADLDAAQEKKDAAKTPFDE